jgi:hypothetical protein
MDVNSMTFGIEIECLLPTVKIAELRILIGGYHRGCQIPGLPVGWTAQRDGSISGEAGFTGLEVVSPVLSGADGVRQVLAVLAYLNSNGAKVNRSTGFHVHVGWNGSAEQTQALAYLVSNYETAIFASTGTKSRQTGSYCKGIQNDFYFIDQVKNTCHPHLISDRYHILNLANIAMGRPTVEFRAFAGTLNVVKIFGYIRICLGLVERAMTQKKKTIWKAKPLFSRKDPTWNPELEAGRTQIGRLFSGLGWARQEGHKYGNLVGEGIPDLKASVAKLKEMAKKYDAQ